MIPKLLTKKETAAALHCSVRQVERYIRDKNLSYTRIGAHVLIYEDSVNAFIDRGDPRKFAQRLLSAR